MKQQVRLVLLQELYYVIYRSDKKSGILEKPVFVNLDKKLGKTLKLTKFENTLKKAENLNKNQ